MKTKIEVLVGIALCTMLLISPAIANGVDTLEIYGNANEDDTIDMRDLTYVKLIFFGNKPETELADAKYDGKINPLDFIQIKLIIVGKEKEITVVDSTDRIVTVNKPVKRIVVFSGWTLEVMRSLKLEKDKIVGVGKWILEKYNYIFFPEFSEYPNVGSAWSSPNYELVLELQPDTVFLSASASLDEVQNKLKSLDPNIVVVRFASTDPLSYIDETRKLGYILGKKEEADAFIDFYNEVKNTITERVEGIPEEDRPKVYLEYYSPYTTFGAGSGSHNTIAMAGGNNIFSDLSGYPEVDPEEVVKRNPEVILRMAGTSKGQGGYATDDVTVVRNIRDEIMNRPELAEVTAVKNGRVYMIVNYFFGARHFLGIGYMAKWFYPDIFEDLAPKAFHQRYLTEFQGLDYDLDEHGVLVYHPEEHPDGK
jgi:iron complex transport system substrate-binding protein